VSKFPSLSFPLSFLTKINLSHDCCMRSIWWYKYKEYF
jgi:hypothetical protein